MPDKPKKIIGIDASRAELAQKTGVEYYSYELIRHLNDLDLADHEIRLYSRVPLTDELHEHPQITNRVINGQRFWTSIKLSWEMIKNPPHKLFIPAHVFPKICPKESYIFIHDVAFRYFKEAYGPIHYRQLVRSTKQAIKRATKILTCSEATKRDLIRLFRAPESLVKVIPHGFNPKRLEQKDPKVIDKLSLKNTPYILFIGRLEIKKNLINLVKAFEIFHLKNPEFKLVLAGKNGHGTDKVFEKIENSPAKDSILCPGYISDASYSSLLENAAIFTLPSLYEGFGFPLLEAMHAETPIVASLAASIPEVAGKAALLANPLDPAKIAESFETLVNHPEIRKELIVKGRERLKEFNWQKCAQKTWDIISS